jgi:hypothetical protein
MSSSFFSVQLVLGEGILVCTQSSGMDVAMINLHNGACVYIHTQPDRQVVTERESEDASLCVHNIDQLTGYKAHTHTHTYTTIYIHSLSLMYIQLLDT